jgi:hypothetical protein
MIDLLMDSRHAIRPHPARTALRPGWMPGFQAVDIGSGGDWRKTLKFRITVFDQWPACPLHPPQGQRISGAGH